MSDGEFWENVEAARHGMTPEQMRAWEYDPTPDEIERHEFDLNPCPLCGAIDACGYDDEGRPMIHTMSDDPPAGMETGP